MLRSERKLIYYRGGRKWWVLGAYTLFRDGGHREKGWWEGWGVGWEKIYPAKLRIR